MRKRKFTRISSLTLDQDAFRELLSIFTTHICGGNANTASQVLGVSRPTLHKWRTEQPKQHWWLNTLINVMDQCITELLASKRRSERDAGILARDQMQPYRAVSRAAKEANLELEVIEGITPCRRHILHKLAVHGQVSTRKLRQPAHCGGFSQAQIKRALASFDGELDKDTTGFGADKVTYYRLPDD